MTEFTHPTPYACAIKTTVPFVWTSAQTTGTNHCYTGVGVTWMEMWVDLVRWNRTDQRWNTLNSCYRSFAGATTLECTTSFNCNHPNTLFDYRGDGMAYSIKSGIGYLGTYKSGINSEYCY